MRRPLPSCWSYVGIPVRLVPVGRRDTITPAYDRKCGSVEPTEGRLYALKCCGRPNLHVQHASGAKHAQQKRAAVR